MSFCERAGRKHFHALAGRRALGRPLTRSWSYAVGAFVCVCVCVCVCVSTLWVYCVSLAEKSHCTAVSCNRNNWSSAELVQLQATCAGLAPRSVVQQGHHPMALFCSSSEHLAAVQSTGVLKLSPVHLVLGLGLNEFQNFFLSHNPAVPCVKGVPSWKPSVGWDGVGSTRERTNSFKFPFSKVST